MRKKYSLIIGIISIGILAICIIGIIVFRNRVSVISGAEAETVLRNYLIGVGRWDDDYVLQANNPITGEIGSNEVEVYRFEVRFKDTVEEVGGGLISNYAITVDGNIIFWYDPANDWYVVQ